MARRAKGEGGLFKVKGSRFWYAQYYDQNGKQVRASTGTDVKQEAIGVLRRLMGDDDRGLVSLTELRKISYGHLRAGLISNYQEKGNATLYQTDNGDETIGGLKALDAFFGFSADNPGVPITQITTEAARQFARQRSREGFSPATVNRSLACLRRMLQIAREDGKIQNVPKIRLLKEPAARKGFLAIEDFDKLLKALPVHLKPLVLFLYWCGTRLGEAKQIEWSQVDLTVPCIRLEEDQTKNAEARIVPLPPVLVSILSGMNPKTGRVFDATNLRTEWAKACEAVGLGARMKETSDSENTWYSYKGLIVHDLRRSAIRNLVNCGVPERIAMKISGHKTRSIFDRYHIVSPEDVVAAMQRVVHATLPPRKKSSSARLVKVGSSTPRKLLRARSSNG
jgi:integrase